MTHLSPATQLEHAIVTKTEPRLTIAIDGTAGSGKSALGSLLAARLGYLFVDTGVFYRVLTLAALRGQVSVEDGPALAALAGTLDVRIVPPTVPGRRRAKTRPADGRQFTLLLGTEDVTWAIRSSAIDANVSQVAAQPEARAALLPLQQRLARQKNVVMVGRDIGTVVCPEAEVKVFLPGRSRHPRTAPPTGARRAGDGKFPPTTSPGTSLTATRLTAVARRRRLHKPPDAIVLDTSQLTLEQEATAVLARVEAVRIDLFAK